MSVDSIGSTFFELSLPGFNKMTFEHAFIHISVMNFDSYRILFHTRTLLRNMKEIFREYAVALLAKEPRISIYGSNFPFIHPVEYLEIVQFFFVFAHSVHKCDILC